MPVLWLCGPPGVGKTTVGWELYSQRIGAGLQTGYVDIDQLGICYPEPASDPGRHRMKARNLHAVIASFQAAGAGCVIVSGVVDPAHGVPVDEIPQAALTMCRLRAHPDELRQRFIGRQGQVTDIAKVREMLQEADELDSATVTELCVDTSGRSVAEVACQVLARTNGWPTVTSLSRPDPAAAPTRSTAGIAGGTVLWLSGATGVGKSTVGFTVFQKVLRAGQMMAYLDLEQINFYGPAPGDHQARAGSLAAIWRTYRTAGAKGLVMVGPVDDEATVRMYADALSEATMTVCRLHAGPDQLTKRIIRRGQGGSWSQPGDPLKGQAPANLLRATEQALLEADALERAGIGIRIDTSTHTAEQAADMVLAQSGWPYRTY